MTRAVYAPCPVCGSTESRAGFCCDGVCHDQYMAACYVRWSLPGTAVSVPEPSTPPESKPTVRELIVRDICSLLCELRRMIFHPGRSMYVAGDPEPTKATARTSRVVHARPRWRDRIEQILNNEEAVR